MKKLLYIFSFLVFIYLLLRGIYQPFVHDESVTFFTYILKSRFWPWNAYLDANNHVLNSFTASIFYKSFGLHSWNLRLPSLLSYGLFISFTIKTTDFIKHRTLKLLFFLSMLSCHNFIDFFTLSRGYGMSMAFLMGLFYYQIKDIEKHKISNQWWIGIFLFFAIWSNLTLFYVGVILWILNGVIVYLQKGPALLFLPSLFQFLVIASAYIYLSSLRDSDALYYGAGGGFWEITVGSFSEMLFENNGIIVKVILFCIGMLAIFPLINGIFKRNHSVATFFSAIFSGALLLVFLAHFIFGINYPEDRVALYFFPLIIITLFFMMDELKKQNVAIGITSTLVLLNCIQFISIMNLSHNHLWRNEQIPERFLEKISEQRTPNINPTISSFFIQSKSIDIMNYTYFNGSLNQIQSSVYPDTMALYQIVNDSMNLWPNYEIIDSVDYADLKLLKRKRLPLKDLLVEKNIEESGPTSKKFTEFINLPLDSNVLDTFLGIEIDLKLDIECETATFFGIIVSSIESAESKSKFIYQLDRSNLHTKASFLLPEIPQNAEKVIVYVLNKNDQSFKIDQGFIRISGIK